MDPFTALGVAAAIVQFVELGSKLISTSREIYLSAKGLTQEHETLDDICSHLGFMIDDLDGASDVVDEPQQKIAEEIALRQLSEKCRSTAVELQGLLRSLYRTPGGKIASLHAAITATWGKRKVADVAARLKEYRQELVVHLVAITSNQQSSVLRELKRLREVSLSMQLNHSVKLDEISSAIQSITLKSSLTKELPSQEGAFTRQDFNDLPNKLLDLAENACEVSAQQRILRSLYFRSMPVRHRSIAEAHAKTFGWALRRKSEGEEAAAAAAAAAAASEYDCNFSQWLEAEKGIYWISGKAGSGKSTLVKFLGDHPRTLDLLTTWSYPHECVVACHYFWSAGTRLQKSTEGLLRSLLFEILRQSPHLATTIIPQDLALDSYSAGFTPGEEGRPWSMFELTQIVDRLCACDDMSVRFCFFIDGLDEYGGDHNRLIGVLERLAASSNVKLCVSSRPWNVFRDAYGVNSPWRLSLQDLTRDDILCYTESKMKEHPNWRDYSSASSALIHEITNKAQGVFLWVFLVVRSLHEGLTNSDSLATLRYRISQLPQDLEAFFKHMLDAIEPIYYRQMAQSFKTALRAEEPLSIMLYSLVDECADDNSPALHGPVSPMDHHDIYTRRRQMRRRLDGRCKGLLEIQADRSAIDYLGPRVNFLHRTVRDFLLTKEMAEFLDNAAPDFNANLVIFRAYVALIKSMPVKKDHFQRSGVLTRILAETFIYAYQAETESGSSEAELVDELRDVVEDVASSFGAETPWDPGYFVDFAISKGLSQYLSQHQECATRAQAVVNGSFLQEALTESVKPGSGDGVDLTGVVSLFLSRGTNPNRGCRTQRLSRESLPVKFERRLWNEANRRRANINGSLWGGWLAASSEAMSDSGLNYTWAVRQKRILDLVLGHGADVNEISGYTARWGDFVEALFRLSEHSPDHRLSNVYVGMLKALLRHGASPNAPHSGSTISKVFFASIRAEISGASKLPSTRLSLLAQMAEALLQHGAHPSCLASSSELESMFPPRLAKPLLKLWEARQAETRTSVMRVVQDMLWWPWS